LECRSVVEGHGLHDAEIDASEVLSVDDFWFLTGFNLSLAEDGDEPVPTTISGQGHASDGAFKRP